MNLFPGCLSILLLEMSIEYDKQTNILALYCFVISVPGGNKNILLDMMTHEIKHVSDVTKHFFGA